jgi:hypothetical protein
MKMGSIPPILLSAIICDRVIFDRITGMPSLINIIQTINASKYPIRNIIVFFCELTNGHGMTNATIKLVHTEREDRVLFEQKGQVEFKDVQQTVTLAVSLQGVVFPEPGEYRFQLFADERLLGERKVICRQIQLPEQKENPPANT